MDQTPSDRVQDVNRDAGREAPRRHVAIGSVALLALSLVACGGGGGGGGGSPAPAPVSSPSPSPSPSPAPAPAPTTAADATRLADQATFGANDATVAAIVGTGAAGWVDAQLAQASTGYTPIAYIDPNSAIGCPTGSPSTCYRDNYTAFPVQLQFFRNAMTAPDQLRQRVAFAWSQIFVTSAIDITAAYGMREYHQMLLDNAFGNYRTLLERVTLSPVMGDYLDMVNNDKPNASRGTQANENYAREVLQLFSIGLSKLNADGTVQRDGNGVAIPTYDQPTVQAFARAFTGWTYASRTSTSQWTNPKNYIGDMVAFESHHDTESKTLLNGSTASASQTARADLTAALDNIFAHPNVGPFIGRQMIQFLVTSNPSPAYVARITAVFNDNGAGVRGDMKAVIRAILLDPEARGDAKTDPSYGKLRDPTLFAVGVARAFNAASDGVYPNAQSSSMGEAVFTAPSVFSFFPPDYAVPDSATLLGPQFGVQNTTTTIARFNYVNAMLYSTNGIAADPSVSGSTGTRVDLSGLQSLAATPATLVDKLDTLMTHGTMTAAEKSAIVTAVSTIAATDTLGRARSAAYLVAASPRYQITR